MDETLVYFDLVPAKIVDTVVKSEKRHITVPLTTTANGEMLPPFIIFKEKRQLKLGVISQQNTNFQLTFHDFNSLGCSESSS